MSEVRVVPTTLVVDDRVFNVSVDRSGAPKSFVVTVEINYERSWSFEEPGWQDLAFGVADGRAYWWSARRLVVMPTDGGEPVMIAADEDIRLAFAVGRHWVVVCETSVRLFVDGKEVSRLDASDVVLAARWEGSQLVARDAAEHDLRVSVADDRLTT